MFLIRLWNFIRGYVIIEVSGYFTEKFINICTRRQILLWDILWSGAGKLRMKMSIKAFKSIRSITKKSGCRVKLAEKKGLPFILNRYRGRTGFLIGILVFAVLLYILSSMIWAIEIIGNDEVPKTLLIDQLHEMNIYRGKLKYGIDTKTIVNRLMNENKQLTWVGAELKGAKLKIQVAEGVNPPEIIPKDDPCNIIAEKDGFILKVEVKEGVEKVKEGETVHKGQLLISGDVESSNPLFGSIRVHSIGTVEARTWYESSMPVLDSIMVKERTGDFRDKRFLFFLDLRVPLPGKDIEYGNVEKIVFDKTIGKEGKYKLPVGVTIERYFELDEKEIILDEVEAQDYSVKKATEDVYKKIDPQAQVVAENQTFHYDQDGKQYAVVTLECIEDIGIEDSIGGD